MAESYRNVGDTPEKTKRPADGYQTRGVGRPGTVPAMSSRVTQKGAGAKAPTANGGAPMSGDGAILD